MLQLLLTAASAFGQQLPIRWYTVRDGLAFSDVLALFQDSRGYLWVGTFDGLSRFDGSFHAADGIQDGLPNPVVNAIAEDGRGRVWVATNGGGVARLVDEPAAGKFRSFHISAEHGADVVNALVFDGSDRLWCVTEAGLYRADTPGEPRVFERLVPGTPGEPY